MSLSEADLEYKKKYEGEKSRAIIWLGLLAIIVTARAGLRDNEFWNFPCNSPCIHVTWFLAPLFDNLIWLWLGYAACMLVYFSEDYFDKFRLGRQIREMARRVVNIVFLYTYPAMVVFFTGTSAGYFVIPEWAQTVYSMGVAGIFGLLVILGFEGLIGQKVIGKRSVLRQPLESFIELARGGIEVLGEGLEHLWKRSTSRFGRPETESVGTPLRWRRLVAFLVLVISGASAAVAWLIAKLPFLSLIYVFGGALYVIFIAIAFVGLRARSEASRS